MNLACSLGRLRAQQVAGSPLDSVGVIRNADVPVADW